MIVEGVLEITIYCWGGYNSWRCWDCGKRVMMVGRYRDETGEITWLCMDCECKFIIIDCCPIMYMEDSKLFYGNHRCPFTYPPLSLTKL